MMTIKKHIFWAIALCILATSFTTHAQSGLYLYGNGVQFKSKNFQTINTVLGTGTASSIVKEPLTDPALQFGYGGGFRLDIGKGFGFLDLGYDYANSTAKMVLTNDAVYNYKLSQSSGLIVLGIKIGGDKGFYVAPSGGFWMGTQKQDVTITEGTNRLAFAPPANNIKGSFNFGAAFALSFGTNGKRINLFGRGIYYTKGFNNPGVATTTPELNYSGLGIHAGLLIAMGNIDLGYRD
jgi:hypothetical protein